MEKPVHFKDFTPPQGLALYADSVITRLTDLVPTDSTVIASVAKTLGNYICKIEILSHIGSFVAEIKGEEPKKTIEGAEKKIKEFISKWHKTRFLDQIAKVV